MAEKYIGTAWVQIKPSTEGIGAELHKSMDPQVQAAGEKSGGTAGVAFAKKMIGAVAAAGIAKKVGDFVKSAVDEGAALQQSIGGIETLFKDNADTVIKYAQDAYKTAGVSANTYMENVTSFSASLLQGLGGDTAAAAEIANMAMIDMSDNANKFGTDIESVQNAYQGLAKGNYTMLDNLKLGFAGTKEGMLELVNASGIFEGQVESLDDVSFAQMIQAIHAVQTNLDVTGTTASEAATTLSGSIGMMKSAWSNLLGALALGDGVDQALTGFSDSLQVFLSNLVPMISTVFANIPGVLSNLLLHLHDAVLTWAAGLPDRIHELAENLATFVDSEGQSTGTRAIGNIIIALGKALIASAPDLLAMLGLLFQYLGSQLIYLIDDVVASALPAIQMKGAELINRMKEGMLTGLENIKAAANEIITAITTAISAKFGELTTKGRELLDRIKTGIKNGISGLASIGHDIVTGIWRGISGAAGWLFDQVKNFASNIIKNMMSALKIGSPSKVAEEDVGYQVPAGVAIGINKNAAVVKKAIDELVFGAIETPQLTPDRLNYDTVGAAPISGPININVYGAEGQDERAIANYVARMLADMVGQKELAYA